METRADKGNKCYLAFSPPLQVKVGGRDAQAVAILIIQDGDKVTKKYLVGVPDAELFWVDEDTISLPPRRLGRAVGYYEEDTPWPGR